MPASTREPGLEPMGAEAPEPPREPTEAVSPASAPPAPERLRLVVLSGPDAGREILLERGTYLVGKSESCQLSLSDTKVSHRHLELQLQQRGVHVRDLGSTNGSFYGGARFSQILVRAGAVIAIGATELKLLPPATSAGILPSREARFGGLCGTSLRMREVYAVLERVAGSEVAILLEGETGTGKELAAEALHAASARHRGPFVVCDLAGVSRSLIESELYGHVRGAFTGADRDRPGAFELAHGGTIFIDELGELELEAQPRLLRAIERRQVKPVGSGGYRDVDVRIIAASGRDLAAEVRAGRFREDLFHRLAVVRISLPPLRERKEDLPMLAESFLGGRAELSPDSLALLYEYDWPGNVRELRNVMERAISLLPPGGAAPRPLIDPHLLGLSPALPPGRALPAGTSYREVKERLLHEWERSFIQDLLRRAGGNVSLAARQGGLDRVYLHRLIKKHGLSE